MAKSTIQQRRKLRAIEAARDKHLEQITKSKEKLAQIRAELGHARKSRGA
jgi:hypothetical protein